MPAGLFDGEGVSTKTKKRGRWESRIENDELEEKETAEKKGVSDNDIEERDGRDRERLKI